MITVIIPTMWMVDRLHSTLTELNACEHVGEIILIKGVELAQYEKLLILNDDTWFDWNEIERIEKHIIATNGMLGIGTDSYNLKKTTQIELAPMNKRPTGFACAFFIHKTIWIPIPEHMRIWGGDEWLFNKLKHQGKQNYKLVNFKVGGHLSTTVNSLRKDETLRLMMVEDAKYAREK